MIDIHALLAVPYVDRGRTMEGLDCWGQLLLVRQAMGLPELPSIGPVSRAEPIEMQRQYKRVHSTLEVCEAQPGAVAAVFRGTAFVHVGVVVEIDGRLAVLETNQGSGPRWKSVADFVDTYYKVIFYRDKSLPEQADA